MAAERRAGRTRVAVAVALAGLAALAAGAGCSGGDTAAGQDGGGGAPTADQREVCDALQALVDEVVAGRGPAAMQRLTELEAVVRATGDAAMRSDGEALFDTIGATVPDPGSLTPEESGAVGDQALARALPALGGLLDGCAQAGLALEGLPGTPAGADPAVPEGPR